jgi:lysozyme
MILGFDASFYQDNNATAERINWEKAKAAGARFAIIRASQNLSIDEDFEYNWKEAKRVGIPRGAYHFYDYRNGKAPAVTQAEFFWSLLKADPGEIAPSMDFERPTITWPELPSRDACIDIIRMFFFKMDNFSGRKTIFYTNASTIRYVLNPVPADIVAHPLWVAAWPIVHQGQTPEQAAVGFKPYTGSWPSATLHQFTTVLDGKKYGMESSGLDGDHFMGDEAAFAEFIGGKPVEVELSMEEMVHRLWEQAEVHGWAV